MSMTATTTSGLPVVTLQASGASTSASGVAGKKPIAWPTLSRPQSWENAGSLGVLSAVMM